MTRSGRTRLPRMFAGRRARLLAFLIAIGLVQALSAVATVLLVRHIFDLFLRGRPALGEAGLWLPAATLGACALLDGWLRMVERVRAEELGQEYVLEVRGALFAHLVKVSPRVLRSQSRGGMLLRFLGDLTPLRQWLSLGVARIVIVSLVVPVALCALSFLSWRLAACVLVALVLGLLASLAQGRSLQRSMRDVRRLRAHLATNVSEKLSATAVVQVHHRGRREAWRIERQGRKLLSATLARARALGQLRAWTRVTSGVATLLVLLVGVHQVTAGSATPGLVVAAMTLTGLIVPGIDDLGRVLEYWQGARISREKLEGFLALPARLGGTGEARRRRRGRGRLRFADVSVAGALERVSAVARAGQVTVVLGPNGAGKSTLLALAAGLIDPDGGRVLLDGKDLSRLCARDLRRAVGIAGPDLPLLRGTLRDNLRYRWLRAPQEELERVCVLCGVDEILAELPDGLDTRIREGGAGLSLGQRQRIALARALLGTPDVLLLDEVDSNLDQSSRAALERVLAHYPGTVLLATHDPELAHAADAVWRLKDGSLVETSAPAVGNTLQGDSLQGDTFQETR